MERRRQRDTHRERERERERDSRGGRVVYVQANVMAYGVWIVAPVEAALEHLLGALSPDDPDVCRPGSEMDRDR